MRENEIAFIRQDLGTKDKDINNLREDVYDLIRKFEPQGEEGKTGKQSVEERLDMVSQRLNDMAKRFDRTDKKSKEGGDLTKKVEKID